MKLSIATLLLVVAIGCNYIQEAESQFWNGFGGRFGNGFGGGFGNGFGGGFGSGFGLGFGGFRPFVSPFINPWNQFGGFGSGWGGWNRRFRWGKRSVEWGGQDGWGKRSVEIQEPTLKCSYTESTKLFACKGLTQTVECDASKVFDKRIATSFTLFGISSAPFGGLKTKTEEIKYSLYPEKLDMAGFMDTRVVDPVLQKSFTYSLYHLPQYTDSGIRVKTPICWKKVIDLLSEVTLKVETIPVLKEDGKTENVKVLGRLTFN